MSTNFTKDLNAPGVDYQLVQRPLDSEIRPNHLSSVAMVTFHGCHATDGFRQLELLVVTGSDS